MCRHQAMAWICHACEAADIAEVYLEAKRAYYAGEPVMTDTGFDYIEQRLRDKDPTHPALEKVGG